MRCILFVFLFISTFSLAQESIEFPETPDVVDSNGEIVEPVLGVISREDAERRRNRTIQNSSPEIDVTYGFASPENEAIRMLFLQPESSNGFEANILDESERVIVMTASAIITNGDSEMEELESYCGWLLNDEISKTPREVADQFILIEERSAARIIDEYRDLLARLSNDTANFIESRKQAVHSNMRSQNLNVLTLFNQDPVGFVNNWRNRCETRF